MRTIEEKRAYGREHHRKWRLNNPTKMYDYTCQICSDPFTNSHPPGSKNSPKICRKTECRKKYFLNWQRKNKNKLTDENGMRPCKICATKFVVSERNAGHNAVTCSDSCQEIYRKKWSRENKRKSAYGNSIGAIEVDDVMFYTTYKEPLRAVEKGHGYYGTLLYSPSKDVIQCHECGEWFKALYGGYKGHLTTHDLDKNKYLEKYELSRTTKLIAEGVRNGARERYMKRDAAFYVQAAANLKTDKAMQNRRTATLGKRIRLETKNKRGNCPDQLLDKITQVVEENNGRISIPLFKEKWGTTYQSTIAQTFGTWKKAVELVGFRDGRSDHYTDVELLTFMSNFYQEFKRVPVNTDFARGYLPSVNVYYRRFKTLNEARRRANIPQLIMTGACGHWLETKNLKTTLPAFDILEPK